jgi:hypothetical protein
MPLGSINLILHHDLPTAVATVQSYQPTLQYIQTADFDGEALRALTWVVGG